MKIYFSFLLILFSHVGSAQTIDSIESFPLKRYNFHLGAGTQKNIFVGATIFSGPFVIECQLGYDLFLDHQRKSASIAWGYAPELLMHQPGLFYSLMFTLSEMNPAVPDKIIITVNTTWISQHETALSWALGIGAGVKLRENSTGSESLFINLEGQIGFAF